MRAEQLEDEEEELRQEMVANFKQTGILDSVKANMRKQIVDRLQNKDFKKEETAQILLDNTIPQPKVKDFYESQRIFGYLIADYLRTYDLNYSYGIFLPEMHISAGQVLSKEEICQAIGVEKYEYESLKKDRDKVSAIESLVEIVKKKRIVQKTNREVQTENPENAQSLSMKIDNINHEYLRKMDYHNLLNSKNVEEQMHFFRRDCEEKCKADMEIEIQRIREYEILQVRAAESEHFEQKLLNHRKELDRVYNQKLSKLKTREKEILEICNKKLNDLEKIQFENRQKHMAYTDAINQKEMEFRRHNCLDQQEVKEEREKLQKKENELKEKIKEYEQAKSMITTRVEDDIRKKRKQIEKEQMQHQGKLRDIKQAVSEEVMFLQQQKEHLKTVELQRQYLSDDNAHLKRDLTELEYIRDGQQKEIQALRDQVRKLKESIDANDDRFDYLTKQKIKLEEELHHLKEETLRKETLIDQKQNDQFSLHQQYTMDMERSHLKLLDTEKKYSFKIEQMREQAKNDSLFLRQENKQLSEINMRLDEEVTELRRELRAIKRQLRETETKQQENQRIQELERSIAQGVVSTSPPRVALDLADLNIDQTEYRNNLDNLYKEMKELKEKARLELAQDNP